MNQGIRAFPNICIGTTERATRGMSGRMSHGAIETMDPLSGNSGSTVGRC